MGNLLERMWVWTWEHAAKLSLATWTTILGLLFYTAQANNYELFYHRLSVDLEDVGLSYIAILAHSRQQIIYPVILILLSVLTLREWFQVEGVGKSSAGQAGAGGWSRVGWIVITVACVLAFWAYTIIVAIVGDNRIRASATAVRDGHAIQEVKSLGLPVLNVQVREATIEPVGGANEAPAVRQGSGVL